MTDTTLLRGLTAYVYRTRDHDTSNGGLSAHFERVCVIDPGNAQLGPSEPDADTPPVVIVRRDLFGEVYVHVEEFDLATGAARRYPDRAGPMFGGTFVYTSDGRLRDVCSYPIPFHDRWE